MNTQNYKKDEGRKTKDGKSFSSLVPRPSSFSAILIFVMVVGFCAPAFAEDKSWNAEGDGVDWFDPANWLSIGKPQSTDNAKVDLKDASVDVGQAFEAKSLTIGGKKTSTVNVSNFVSGTLEPDGVEDEALIVRKDGKIIIKGSTGTITMKGTYKDSEEVIPEEPGFMVYVK